MKLWTGKALLMGVAIATAGAVACSVGPSQGPSSVEADEPLGVVGLRLALAPGVSINTLNWTIHNSALLTADLMGSVDVSNSQSIQFVIGGLPAGTEPYTITLSATTIGDRSLTCLGSAPFTVVANATSPVAVTLVCGGNGSVADAGNTGSILISGTTTIGPSCAAVTALSASPSTANVGGSIHLVATGIDATGSSAGVGFAWAVTSGPGSGAFGSPTSASPVFTCTGVGPLVVTVTATTNAGGACANNTQSQVLICTSPSQVVDSGPPDTGIVDSGPPDTGIVDSGPPDTGIVDSGPPDTGIVGSGPPDARTVDSGPPDTGIVDSGPPDTGVVDSGPPDTGVVDSGPPDTGVVDSGPPDTGIVDSGLTTTQSILSGRSADCLSCVQTNGCLDPAAGGGVCESIVGTDGGINLNANLLPGALPDGKTCSAVLGSSTVSEESVCLQTLSTIFTSQCGVTFQLTPCLCGATDTGKCISGTAVPTGGVFDIYACDFATTNGSTINSLFQTPSFGAGIANGIGACAGSFNCNCF